MPSSINARRRWTELADAQLLAQCQIDTYRASGPGGQKRNKTSSAVRLRHLPSTLIVIAEESRSQHENRARALKRLRRALVLEIREPIAAESLQAQALLHRPELAEVRRPHGRIHLGPKDPRYWPLAGLALDALQAAEARVSVAAAALGLTTANLVDFLRADPKLWQHANRLRAQFHRKPLTV